MITATNNTLNIHVDDQSLFFAYCLWTDSVAPLEKNRLKTESVVVSEVAQGHFPFFFY